MRILTAILLGLLLLVQYPLWLGKGSWMQVWDTQRQLAQQQQTNAKLTVRNAAMYAEVRDLKQGLGAIEERARNELGMVRKNEVFFQILDVPPPNLATLNPATPTLGHGTTR
ncbi:MAG: cell division protein FtsB [Sulfuriferula sp.]|nr:cell division protein FtsB [Sulfuriferula sp.]